jgi:GR25 family glycosyltransferase involved in LPS biosynthesis
MKIQDFFKKGYYINLDKRPERRECFLSDMQKVGLDSFFERFPAFYHGAGDFKYNTTHQACGRSTVTAIKQAYDAGYENLLIFEDDAYFLEGGLEAVERSLDTLAKIEDWDLIYFGGMIQDHELNLVGDSLLKQDKLLTTHALGYNRKTMAEIIDFWKWDVGGAAIDGWYAEVGRWKKFVTYPLAVVQYEHRPSDLNGGISAGLEDYTRGYINKPINKLF